jgi:hypothetical protein
MLNIVNYILIYSHFVSSVRAEQSSAKVKCFWARQRPLHTHHISRRLTTSANPTVHCGDRVHTRWTAVVGSLS